MRPITWYVLLGIVLVAVEGLLSLQPDAPTVTALSMSGHTPSEAEMAAELDLIRQRVAARDDAIELLLLHVQAQNDVCHGGEQ